MASTSDALQADELSRRISEIDLTNQRRRTDTITSTASTSTSSGGGVSLSAPTSNLGSSTCRYSREQLLRLAPSGVATPLIPNPPPTTPTDLPLTPPSDDQLAVLPAGNAPPQPAAKKKKKKSSGKNRKAPPSGFEGTCLPDLDHRRSCLAGHEHILTCIPNLTSGLLLTCVYRVLR
jgi:hypothetical protein